MSCDETVTNLKAARDKKEYMNHLLDVESKYQDLIMCVGNKHPDETRHETAKRYLIERDCASSAEALEIDDE